MESFADIPVTVDRLLTSGERTAVGVVLLDAFGRCFVERHADHPFLDGNTLYQRLPVPATVLQPSVFSPSPYDRVFAAGARLQPFATLALGVQRFFDALADGGYAFLYWHHIDAAGHEFGPGSSQFEAAAVSALDTLEAGMRSVPGALVLVTADYGQVPVDPAWVDYLDELWPELPKLLTQRPAGSSRDVFLHTVPGAAETVAAGLAERLGDRAQVRPAADLSVSVGPALRARLADICVLPADGRTAWLRSAPNVAAAFRGHHGGLHPDETETWVGAVYS